MDRLMKFEMSETETAKAKAWISEQEKKGTTKDATGFRFGFLFHPTGFGNCVKVLDSVTNEEIDVSDDI